MQVNVKVTNLKQKCTRSKVEFQKREHSIFQFPFLIGCLHMSSTVQSKLWQTIALEIQGLIQGTVAQTGWNQHEDGVYTNDIPISGFITHSIANAKISFVVSSNYECVVNPRYTHWCILFVCWFTKIRNVPYQWKKQTIHIILQS